MERAYPTQFGMPVSSAELGLKPSKLDPANSANYSNHHLHYEARFYRESLLFNTLRNLEFNQERMLNDQHNLGRLALHTLYSPPKPPTNLQAMNRLAQGYADGERLKVFDPNQRKYIYHPITPVHYSQLLIDYENRED